jgi:hypothetical protein
VRPGFACHGREIERQEFRESLGTPDDRTKPAAAQKIVAYAMPFGKARLPSEIRHGIQKIDGSGAWRVLNVKGAARQELIEIPLAPRRNAGGRSPDDGVDLGVRHGLEDPFQDQQVEVFIAERKAQVISKIIAGPAAFIEDGPAPLFPVAARICCSETQLGGRTGAGIASAWTSAAQPANLLPSGTTFYWKTVIGVG